MKGDPKQGKAEHRGGVQEVQAEDPVLRRDPEGDFPEVQLDRRLIIDIEAVEDVFHRFSQCF